MRRRGRQLTNFADATLSKRQKTVNRAYGGSVCAPCVKQRSVPLPPSTVVLVLMIPSRQSLIPYTNSVLSLLYVPPPTLIRLRPVESPELS